MNLPNRLGRSLTRTVSQTGDGLDVRYPYGTMFLALVPALGFGLIITHGNTKLVGVLAVIGFAIAPLTYLLIRLTADDTGVHVMDWGFTNHLAWADIADFELNTSRITASGRGERLRIRMNDGRTFTPLATRQSRARFGEQEGYSNAQLAEILEFLRSLQRRHSGIQDPPEMTAALQAVEAGNPDLLDQLLASHRIMRSEYTFRLHQLAAAGRVDLLEALRQARRQEFGES